MTYVLAILLPTVAILFAGRPFVAVILTPVWVLALIFAGGLTHPMFVLLAWLIVFERRQAGRAG